MLVAPGGTDEEGEAVSGLSLAAAVAGAIAGTTDPAPWGRGAQRTVWAGDNLWGQRPGPAHPGRRDSGRADGWGDLGGAGSDHTNHYRRDGGHHLERAVHHPGGGRRDPGIRSALRSKFHRAKNTEQSRGPSAPRWCWSWRTERSGEIISGYDNVAVSADPDNPTVCQVEFSFSAAQGLNQIWLTAHITV